MPTNPRSSGREPAEGSRDTAETELQRSQSKQPVPPRAGDEARPGTPGTGEDVCRTCKGTGTVGSRPCPYCDGTGRVIKAIGGA